MKLTRCRAVSTLVVATALVFVAADRAESSSPASTQLEPASRGASVSEKSFQVAVAVPDKVARGTKGTVRVSVKPKPGWKLNEEFPTKLTVSAPAGVTVEKAKQRKGDAKHFSTKMGEFDVAFTSSSPGDKSFDAKFKFAVCTDSSCDPKTVKLSWVVSVE